MKVKGCCPLDCQDSCAWVATVENGKVTKVEGAKDHPVTRGVLCAKVKDYEARLTAPGRLLSPLKRSGPKGSGQFTEISWDEALDEIARRYRAIIAEHGAEALMPYSYLGSQGVVQRLALNRIFHALGASRQTGGVCSVSAVRADGRRATRSASIRRRRRTRASSSCGARTCSRPATTSGTSSRRRAETRRKAHRHRPLPHPHRDAMRPAPGAAARLRRGARRRHRPPPAGQRQGRPRSRRAVGRRSRGLPRECRTLDFRAGGGGNRAFSAGDRKPRGGLRSRPHRPDPRRHRAAAGAERRGLRARAFGACHSGRALAADGRRAFHPLHATDRRSGAGPPRSRRRARRAASTSRGWARSSKAPRRR